MENKSNSKATLSLVFGIISIVVPNLCPYILLDAFMATTILDGVCVVLAILGIVFAAKGMGVAKANGTSKGVAIAGLVLSIIGVCVSVPMFLCYGICAGVESTL